MLNNSITHMAVEKGKVLTAIETRFKGKSLTKNFKEKLAEKWAAKIEKDEDIDAYIEDREDVVLEASTEADRRATQAAKKAKEEAAAAIAGKPEKTETEEPALPDGTPEWAKTLIKQNQELAQRVQAFESKQQAQTIEQRFKTDERLKGIPEFMFKGRVPTKDDDFEAAVTELKDDYSKFATEHKLAAFGNDSPPGVPGAVGGSSAKPGEVDPDIVAFGKRQAEAVKPAK